MDRMLIISADGHMTMSLDLVDEYLDADHRDLLDTYREESKRHREQLSFLNFTPEALEVLDTDYSVRSGGGTPWDLHRRLAEMDREGVAKKE